MAKKELRSVRDASVVILIIFSHRKENWIYCDLLKNFDKKNLIYKFRLKLVLIDVYTDTNNKFFQNFENKFH